jgi:DNA-binding MarR family transcriptional regulator
MSRVDALPEGSEPDPGVELTEPAPGEMLATDPYADQLVERIGWALVDAEQRTEECHAHNGSSVAAAAARSVRRATARRASNRRATARSRQVDPEASIIDFLAQHPGSTAGDLAKGLNLNRQSVSTRLTQLAKAGEIKKASRGYRMKVTASLTKQRPTAAQRRAAQIATVSTKQAELKREAAARRAKHCLNGNASAAPVRRGAVLATRNAP